MDKCIQSGIFILCVLLLRKSVHLEQGNDFSPARLKIAARVLGTLLIVIHSKLPVLSWYFVNCYSL
jgi:hypothetical protein